MRLLVQFTMPTATGNEHVRSGKVGKVFEKIGEDLKPEAMYFYPAGGKRAGLMIINTENPSIDVEIVERLSFGLEATVEITPCMNVEDLGNGLANLESIVQNYA